MYRLFLNKILTFQFLIQNDLLTHGKIDEEKKY